MDDNRLADMQRQIDTLKLNQARQGVATAGPVYSLDIDLTGSAVFSIGDTVKCVGGAWSYITSTDTGPQTVGVVTAINAAGCTVTLWGLREAAGTPGTVFFVPDSGGGAVSPGSASGWWRVVELQVTQTQRLVRPDPYGWTPISVQTCVSGTPTAQEFALFSES